MGITEDLADGLAKDVIAAEQKLGLEEDSLTKEISTVIGASSTTTQEAFLTAMRVRRAEARARKYLEAKLSGSDTDLPTVPDTADLIQTSDH